MIVVLISTLVTPENSLFNGITRQTVDISRTTHNHHLVMHLNSRRNNTFLMILHLNDL